MDVPRTRAISALHVPESLLPHLLAQCAVDDTHGAWKITHVIRTHQGEGIPGHAQPDRGHSQRALAHSQSLAGGSSPSSSQPLPAQSRAEGKPEEDEEATAHEEHQVDPLTRQGYASLVQYLSQTATLLVAFDYGRPYDAHFYERVLEAAVDAQVSFLLFISLMTSADDEGASQGEFVRRHRVWKDRISERCPCHHAWVHTVPSFQDLLLWNFPHHLDGASPPDGSQDGDDNDNHGDSHAHNHHGHATHATPRDGDTRGAATPLSRDSPARDTGDARPDASDHGDEHEHDHDHDDRPPMASPTGPGMHVDQDDSHDSHDSQDEKAPSHVRIVEPSDPSSPHAPDTSPEASLDHKNTQNRAPGDSPPRPSPPPSQEEEGRKEKKEKASAEGESQSKKQPRVLRSPFAAEQEVALVDCEDVARAILAIIQDPSDHADQEYQITGRETLTVGGLMRVINHATREYEFSYEQDNSLQAWARAGYHPDWSQLVSAMIGQAGPHPSNPSLRSEGSDLGLLQVMALVSDDIEELTGQLPHTFEEFIPDLLAILQEQSGPALRLGAEDTVDLSRAIAVAQPPSEELQALQALCQETAQALEQLVVAFQMDCERQTSKLLSLFPQERGALADWTDDPSQIRELEGSQTVMLRSLAVLQRTVQALPPQVEDIASRYKDTMERRVQAYEAALQASQEPSPSPSPDEKEETPSSRDKEPARASSPSPSSRSKKGARYHNSALHGSPPVSLDREEMDTDEERTEGSRQPRQPLSRGFHPQLGTPTHAGEPGIGWRSTLGEESSSGQTLPFDAHGAPPRSSSAPDSEQAEEESEGEKRKRRKVGRIRRKIKRSDKSKKKKAQEHDDDEREKDKKQKKKRPSRSSTAGDQQTAHEDEEGSSGSEGEERGPRGKRRRKTKRERGTAARLHTFRYGAGSANSSSVSYSSSFSSDLSFSSDSTSDEMPYMNKDEDEVESLMRGEYEHRETQAAPEPLFLPLRPQQFADEMQPKDYFHRFIRVEESSSLDVADLPEAFDYIPQVDGERRMDELGIPSVRPQRADRHSRKSCSICESNFSVVNRRHHCRACGQLVDRQCAKNKMVLPNLRYFKPVRICKDCKVLYEKKYKPLMSTA